MKRSSPIIFTAAILFLTAVPGLRAALGDPTVRITSPQSGQDVSNAEFTIAGEASDKGSVTNVCYSLNQSTNWITAVSTNQWLTWTAAVTLVPGENIISAYAVDDAGNYSKTNSAKVTLVAFALMTVHTNGAGSITPNYDGQMLQIGSTYSMKGKAATKGEGVQSWTDGSNQVVTNNATVKFVMASNLVLAANFGDVTSPTLRVSSATTNSNGDPNSIILYGRASDNVGLAGVFFQLNTGAFQSAPTNSTTNAWSNWAVVIDNLAPGQNSINLYAIDTSTNKSLIVPLVVQHDTALPRIANRSAVVVPLDSTSYQLNFGKQTFSQYATDTNHANAVGKYSYHSSGGGATLKTRFTAPAGAAAEDSRTFRLTFASPTTAIYSTPVEVTTNVVTIDTNVVPPVTNSYPTNVTISSLGYMYFDTPPQLAPSKLAYQLYYFIDNNATNGQGALFDKKTFDAYALTGPETRAGKFKYTRYSPVGGLITLTGTNGAESFVLNYTSTNDGSYHSEDYDRDGNTNSISQGRFLISLQQPGGNAPVTATNQAFTIYSGTENFNVVLGTGTYSQDTASTNFDNAVGDYLYSRPDTNIGQLELTTAEPPNLAGNTNSARLIFVSPTTGLLTNEDGSLSTFSLSTATNFTLTSVDNHAFALYTPSSFFPTLLSFTNSDFTLVVQDIFYSITYTGTYNYAVFSPKGSMMHLYYLNDSTNYGNDWLQFNFATTNNGSFYWTFFDQTTNYLSGGQGSFQGY
jgi:hypothetical protein